MDQLRLRPVLPSESSLLKTFVQAYYRFDHLSYSPSVERAIHLLLTDRGLGQAWFIEYEGLECGYVVLTAGFDHEYGGRFGLVTDFYLEEQVRGQGVGKAALGLLIEEAQRAGYQAIELAVTHKNTRAQNLYRSAGFEPLSDRSTMLRTLTASHNQNLTPEEVG